MADFWRVIWHIRLSEVVWPGGMDSVPTALEDSVLTAVERVAARHGIALDGSEESVAAIEFAIEEALLPIVDYLDWAEEAHKYARDARKEDRIYAAVSGELFIGPEYEQGDDSALEALLVYQLDRLIGAFKHKEHERALFLTADIFEIQKHLGEREKRREISIQATERAGIRHKEMNSRKTALIQEWVETRHEYDSRADFARIIGTLRGIKYRTLYEWIADYEKSVCENDEA